MAVIQADGDGERCRGEGERFVVGRDCGTKGESGTTATEGSVAAVA